MATNREPHDIHLVLITRLRNCPLIERPALETGSRESSIESLAKKYPPISSKATRIIVSIVKTTIYIYLCVRVCIFGNIIEGNDLFATRAEFKLLSCIMHSEKVKQTSERKTCPPLLQNRSDANRFESEKPIVSRLYPAF